MGRMMTLYLETAGGFIQWNGEAIDGVLYPLNIEQLWPPEELALLNLHKPAPALSIPAGKVSTALSVQWVDGVVRCVHTLEDAPVIPLQTRKDVLRQPINDIAENRILAIMPEYKQRNSVALGIEAIVKYGPNILEWPPEFRAIYLSTFSHWEKIKAIRAYSDELWSRVYNAETGQELDSVDIHQGWPE